MRWNKWVSGISALVLLVTSLLLLIPPSSISVTGYPWAPFLTSGGISFAPTNRKVISSKNDGSAGQTVGFVNDWFNNKDESLVWNSDGSFTFGSPGIVGPIPGLQLPSYTLSQLQALTPSATTAGRLAWVTDDIRKVRHDTGERWAFDYPVVNVEDFSGANLGARIIAAIAALPAAGGTVDARAFSGSQTATATITLGANVHLLLGHTTLSSSANPGIRLDLATGGAGAALIGMSNSGTLLTTSTASTILEVRDMARAMLGGFTIDGNAKTATIGLSFVPTVGGRNQYSSVRDVRIRQCQTGLILGQTNDFSVVGISFKDFTIDGNNIGIQQNGINTGDIFYSDGAITDNATVGFDMGSSQQAAFRGVSTNGLNGAADFRAGDVGNVALTIEDTINNPAQGPYLLVNGVTGQQMVLSVILKNNLLSWNGTAGNDMITYLGQGTVTIIGGYLQGDAVIRVSPTQALSNSGPSLVDMNVELRGSPEPSFVVTGGKRFSIPAISVNVGTRRPISLTNYAQAESVKTFTSTDATPDVDLGNTFNTAGTTTITNFDNGFVGQTIRIRAVSAITIQNNANIELGGAVDYSMTSEDTLTLTQFTSGVWVEVGRSVN